MWAWTISRTVLGSAVVSLRVYSVLWRLSQRGNFTGTCGWYMVGSRCPFSSIRLLVVLLDCWYKYTTAATCMRTAEQWGWHWETGCWWLYYSECIVLMVSVDHTLPLEFTEGWGLCSLGQLLKAQWTTLGGQADGVSVSGRQIYHQLLLMWHVLHLVH